MAVIAIIWRVFRVSNILGTALGELVGIKAMNRCLNVLVLVIVRVTLSVELVYYMILSLGSNTCKLKLCVAASDSGLIPPLIYKLTLLDTKFPTTLTLTVFPVLSYQQGDPTLPTLHPKLPKSIPIYPGNVTITA